jgi:hypothetical protein
MEMDDEIGRRLWPGIGGQPQAAPQPAAPEQPAQALHAQPKEADEPALRARLLVRTTATHGLPDFVTMLDDLGATDSTTGRTKPLVAVGHFAIRTFFHRC